MVESTRDVTLLPEIVAQKVPDIEHRYFTVQTHFAALKSEVVGPMLQELVALEAGCADAEKTPVAGYRAEVERFFASANTGLDNS